MIGLFGLDYLISCAQQSQPPWSPGARVHGDDERERFSMTASVTWWIILDLVEIVVHDQ
jgi:hypothetical protein